MMKKIVLPAIWIIALAGVFLLTGSFRKNTTQFFGITDNREQSVSFQEPVEITQINVIEGQQVRQGDVLLHARRSELDSQRNLLTHQFDELEARQHESQVTLESEIRVLQAQQRSELARIDSEIQALQGKQQLNSQLFSQITGHQADSASGVIPQQISALQRQRELQRKSLQAQISVLQKRLQAGRDPVGIQKQQLTDRLAELSRQSGELTIRADFSGRIGSVNFREGEKASSFQPILTVHGNYPEYVKGYIHENVSNDVQLGQTVWVHPVYTQSGQPVAGVVEGLGSRIVEYPERLRKNSGIRSWGREVNIRLQENNPLLLGEKVQISFSRVRPHSTEALLTPLGRWTDSIWPNAMADSTQQNSNQHAGVDLFGKVMQ